MAGFRISRSKLPLAAAGLIAAGAACVAFGPHFSREAEDPVQPQAAAAPGKLSRSAVHAVESEDSAREHAHGDLPPPEPGVVTKASDRSVALASSASAGQPFEESGPGSASGSSEANPMPSGAVPERNSPHASPGRSRNISSAGAAQISSQEARIAQSAAALPLSHAISDEQVKQAAPNVPQQTIDQIRDEFEQTAGVNQLDPADPEYARRWDDASRAAADRMRALYGWGAYAEMQRQAALAAAGGAGN